MIRKIFDSGCRLAVYASGSHSSLLSWLTLQPGASRCVVELRNLYSHGAASNVIGKTNNTAVTEQVATALARKAYTNTMKYELSEAAGDVYEVRAGKVLGVGATGAIRSDRDKKGDHKAFIALINSGKTVTFRAKLAKGRRTREEEDRFLSEQALQLVMLFNEGRTSEYHQLTQSKKYLSEDELELVSEQCTLKMMCQMLGEEVESILLLPSGEVIYDVQLDGYGLLAGSFNPVHDGHIKLMKEAAVECKNETKRVVAEISVKNMDKGVKDIEQVIEQRVSKLLEKKVPVLLTMKGMFSDKNSFLKNGHFILGADTLVRLLDSKYYGGSRERMIMALGGFSRCNNRIVVAPRYDSKAGQLVELNSMDILEALRENIVELKNFRVDISSTEIRKRMGLE